MNIPIHFDNEGAHFRIADSELDILNDFSIRDHGDVIQRLPIGKATSMLRLIILAGGQDGRLENEQGMIVASSDMDGEEATIAAYAKTFDPHLKHAVMDIGKVTVDVIKQNEIDSPEAIPVNSFEILSNAYRWAKEVVSEHKDQLYKDPESTPFISSQLIEEMPERGYTALEHQGLWSIASLINDQEISLVRIPDQR